MVSRVTNAKRVRCTLDVLVAGLRSREAQGRARATGNDNDNGLRESKYGLMLLC